MTSIVSTEPVLPGLMLLEPKTWRDERGFFVETYQHAKYVGLGIRTEFIQDNRSRSKGGCIRGLHFQRHPGQAKLVSVPRGAIMDAVVDIRIGSPSFGKWQSFVLDDVDNRQLFIPVGFAHGFCVTSDVADVIYKVSSLYDPEEERGLAWDDSDLAIAWPIEKPLLSERDQQHPRLRDIPRADLPRFA
jgi:dTDP-4-dehydrorhamnose 3,5-epimerase